MRCKTGRRAGEKNWCSIECSRCNESQVLQNRERSKSAKLLVQYNDSADTDLWGRILDAERY